MRGGQRAGRLATEHANGFTGVDSTMNLLKRLVTRLGFSEAALDEVPSLAGPIAMLSRDSRMHPRYGVAAHSLVRLELPGLDPTPVHDLSYGGISVILPRAAAADAQRLPRDVRARLVILDRGIDCHLTVARLVDQPKDRVFVGFAIRHEAPDSLLFLREFIEPLRAGQSLSVIDLSIRKDRYRDPQWLVLRGDGPTDVRIFTPTGEATPKEALVTIRFDDAYAELSVEGGHLATRRSVGGGHGSETAVAQMATTTALDIAILRRSLGVLAGAPLDCRDGVRGLLGMTLAALAGSTGAET
jgi:hypothetical protein